MVATGDRGKEFPGDETIGCLTFNGKEACDFILLHSEPFEIFCARGRYIGFGWGPWRQRLQIPLLLAIVLPFVVRIFSSGLSFGSVEVWVFFLHLMQTETETGGSSPRRLAWFLLGATVVAAAKHLDLVVVAAFSFWLNRLCNPVLGLSLDRIHLD